MSEEKRTLSTKECGLINDRLIDIWTNLADVTELAELAQRSGIDEDELRCLFYRNSRIFDYGQYEAIAACFGIQMQDLLQSALGTDESPSEDDEEDPVPSMRAQILREAERIIYGDREDEYGSPAVNLQATADLWSAYLERQLNAPIKPYDVALMMVLLKVSRAKNGGQTSIDHFVDIAGYAAIAGELLAGKEAKL